MFIIGCHLSVSDGYLAMGKAAASIGANAFQYFTRNPRGSSAKAIDKDDIESLITFCLDNGIVSYLAHAPFTMNLCSDKAHVREFTHNTFEEDMRRVESLPGALYNFHPGNHMGQGIETGIDIIANVLNSVILPEQKVIVLLETMTGKGTEIGGHFEELREIIDRVTLKDKIGVCFDTCHVYDAGYDIVGDLDGVLTEFDRVVGLDRLKAVHINDSKNPLGSRKDRHEKIGEGFVGLDALSRTINHPYLRNLPFYLETPNELSGYADEIALLRDMYKSE